MEPIPRRTRRRALVLIVGLAASAIVLACGSSSFTGTQARFTLCAVDPAQSSNCSAPTFASQTIVAGDFRTLHQAQTLKVLAVDATTNHPLPNLSVRFSVTGANATTVTTQSGADGIATLTYTGANAGTDTIAVTPTSASVLLRSATHATVHWLASLGVTHPIIFLHGINEDANVIQNRQEWVALFEALDVTYNPASIETFCFVDDRAYLDASPPPHCPGPSATACPPTCVSQSHVDDNAVELAKRVADLHARSGKPVTLIGYSMGTAIIRTFLAGCPNSPTEIDADADGRADLCEAAVPLVDQAFFLNGVQQGSWLMTVKQGLDDASNLSVDGFHGGAASPFFSVLPALEQVIFDTLKAKLGGLDATSPAALDLTPGSLNIVDHNQYPIPGNVKIYTFYGAVQLRLSVDIFAYHLAGTQPLPLGDLVLLAQDDSTAAIPPWGGASLCDGCNPLDALGYHGSASGDQFHAWALLDPHDVNIADIIPGAGQSLQGVLGSRVQHLNISQPVAQAPGSGVQVEDITHLTGSATTDMATEILAILMHSDGLA
jgi:pimeloyl-ACP methyl ester carboxylesterase